MTTVPMSKQCGCTTPERGAYLVCRRCGGEYGGPPKAETQQEPKPDALTRLEQWVECCPMNGSVLEMNEWAEDARGMLAEIRKEMEAKQRVIDSLSAKSSEALRMGQQQGRVELAQEFATYATIEAVREACDSIISEEAGQ